MAIVEGTAYWASVKRPNTTYEPVYTVNLVVADETAKDFKRRGFTVKDMNEGPALIIKRKVNGPNGMIRKAPKLIDKGRNPLNCKVGNGSKVKVQYKPWEVERQGTKYKGLDFQGMQVIDLISYSTDGDEFEVEGDDEEMEL